MEVFTEVKSITSHTPVTPRDCQSLLCVFRVPVKSNFLAVLFNVQLISSSPMQSSLLKTFPLFFSFSFFRKFLSILEGLEHVSWL